MITLQKLYPLVNIQKTIENHQFWGKSTISMAMASSAQTLILPQVLIAQDEVLCRLRRGSSNVHTATRPQARWAGTGVNHGKCSQNGWPKHVAARIPVSFSQCFFVQPVIWHIPQFLGCRSRTTHELVGVLEGMDNEHGCTSKWGVKNMCDDDLASSYLTQPWKIPTIDGGFQLGKSSISGQFSMAMLNNQRVQDGAPQL